MKNILTRKEKVTLEQYLEDMFQATNENGELYVAYYEEELYCGTPPTLQAADSVFKYDMTWNKDTYRSVLDKYNSLLSAIEAIAKAEDKENLPNGLKAIYDVYLCPFDGEEDENDDLRSAFYAEKIGGGIKAARLGCFTRRVFKFIELGAPFIIIENEKFDIMESLALNMFATSCMQMESAFLKSIH